MSKYDATTYVVVAEPPAVDDERLQVSDATWFIVHDIVKVLTREGIEVSDALRHRMTRAAHWAPMV